MEERKRRKNQGHLQRLGHQVRFFSSFLVKNIALKGGSKREKEKVEKKEGVKN